MGLTADLNLGAALRSLRRRRGLGLEEASRRSGASKAAISAWENGTRRPRGLVLARLLDALDADPRTKARLLQFADPQQARSVLSDSPFGAPVHFGTVLRMVRGRRGIAQADLSRKLGVSQASVSRWETGDDLPSPETLLVLGSVLGADAEERVALASAAENGDAGLPDDPEHVLARIRDRPPISFCELTFLGWEAELRRRAMRNPRWDACLVAVLSARSCLLVREERYEEIPRLVRQAVALALTEQGSLAAVPAIGSLAHADLGGGRSPQSAVQLAADWAGRLSDSPAKAWMLRQRGMGLARMGRIDEGIAWVARSSEMDLRAKPDHPEPWSHHAEMLVEAHLAAGDARRAAAVVEGRRERLFPSHLYVQIEHALGRAASAAEMAYLRFQTQQIDGSRLAQRRLAAIERRQGWLIGSRLCQPEFADQGPSGRAPNHRETEDRLWAAVLREHPG